MSKKINTTPIEIGHVAHLKSGSPPLTVSFIEPDGIIWVDWFDGAVLKKDAFHIDELLLGSIINPLDHEQTK